nr:3D domain-containing protein [Costertonia aggregata]
MVKLVLLALFSFLFSCKNENRDETDPYVWIPIQVNVSAYNSVTWQTDGQPNIAAWGDTLKPNMKAIAVSRDLLKKGLSHNTMVQIESLPDTFLVKDKMHWKWRNKIDIFMGKDVKRAREWGRKKLAIKFRILKDSINGDNP